nr:hypothetical protein [Tanacetum cinerariifolium]
MDFTVARWQHHPEKSDAFSTGKDESDKGYGTNSLLEQWKDSYLNNDDYDPYDDDMYENHDLSKHLQSICDDLDITVHVDNQIWRIHFIEYGVSNVLNQYSVSVQQTNTAYSNSLNMGAYPTDCLSSISGQEVLKLLMDWLQSKHNLIILEEKSRRAAARGFYQRNNANPSYQERRQSMEESLSKFMNESVKRHEEKSNLIKEIRAFTDTAIRNQGASIKALEIQIRQMSKVLQERGFCSLPSLTETNPIDHVNSISTTVKADTTLICRIGSTPIRRLGELAHAKLTVELADRTVKHPKGIAETVLVRICKFVFPIDFIILDMPEDVNVPLILERPFLSITYIKVDVFKRKITLRTHYMEIIFNDLNEPLELKRNQVDDLKPTIEKGKVVNKPMIDILKARSDFIVGLDDYPSECDFDRRIHIDCAYNLKFSCMIGFEYDKIEFTRGNELENFVNAPLFIGNFYVITDFTVVENMDPYHDEGMGDVIVREPFCKASCVKAKRFDGIITIRDGDDSVTYQIMRVNSRFKHLTNEKCKKIPSLLKEAEEKSNLKTSLKRKVLLGRQPRFGIRRIHAHDTAYLENLTRIDSNYRVLKETVLTPQYAVSNKEDMAYPCMHFTRYHKEFKINMLYPEDLNTSSLEEMPPKAKNYMSP